MTPKLWARAIPALCLSLAVFSASGQTLESAGRGAANPKARYAALQRFAAAHPRATEGAAALLALALADREQGRNEDAIRRLRLAQPRLGLLADYAAYHLAAAQCDLGNFAAAIDELQPVWTSQPPSPLVPDAALLAARAYKESGAPSEGLRVLRRNYDALRQPEGDLLLAACSRSATDLATAVIYFQRVYYDFPASREAVRAETELAELKSQLGELFRPATQQMMLRRADRLADAREYRRALAEFRDLASKLEGAERDTARVRAGVMNYRLYETTAALSYLQSLEVQDPEADAQRLCYIAECARRLERDSVLTDAVDQLAAKHASSTWRMRALIAAGNYFLVRNDAARYIPMYRACAEAFPEEARAGYCHWKVTWNAYVNRQPAVRDMLREHLVRYPGSGRDSAALYFLGRLAEAAEVPGEAKAYYEQITARFPNQYYAALAERRLAGPAVFGAVASAEVEQFLRAIVWPLPPRQPDFKARPATLARMDRARLLRAAGLEDEADRELRFSVEAEKQPGVVAVHLAQTAGRYDAPHQALQLVKRLMPGYLGIDYDSAPSGFWRLLYPLPWRSILERHARQRGLDPFTVAGLIRQESEFNPRAVSPANAYGLTQVMPSTGRQMLKMSRRRFRPGILFNPEVNLRLGTTYLRQVLDSYDGRWEYALAAYNAGPSRVRNWMTWADYREPAEFIETIPFTETREYVMAVLRNSKMYRRIYESEPAQAEPRRLEAVKTQPAAKKAGAFKRSQVVKKKKSTPTAQKKRRR